MNRVVYASNDVLSLVEYQKCDDRALYEDWLDPDTQKGYNGIYVDAFEDFQAREIKQRFFAMIQRRDTGEIIGAVGISPPETIPDLAIWVFKPYRRQGFGTSAFALATKYAIEVLGISELHAGVYPDNIGSQKMLKRCGYVFDPIGTEENGSESHYITGEEVIQMDYMYSPVTIRLAVPADAPDMAEINMRSWEVAYKGIIPDDFIREKNATRPELYRRVITEENKVTYVIQCGGKTVGIMRAAPPLDEDVGEDCYELHFIYLHPDYYRQGIGTKAMDFAFDLARGLGKTAMTVWVLEENVNSVRFYEKCGFVADGKSRIRALGKPLNSIRMKIIL